MMQGGRRMLQGFSDIIAFVAFKALLKQCFSYSFHDTQKFIFKTVTFQSSYYCEMEYFFLYQ